MSANDMNRTKVFKDAKGYSCAICRQRFPGNLTNVSGFQCPACQRVAGDNYSPMHSGLRSYRRERVNHVVERLKNFFSGNIKESDSDRSKSLNYNPSPLSIVGSSPTRSSRKRALLVGVTYNRWKYRLKGTVNDVKSMRKLLTEFYDFQPQNIVVLTEEETSPEFNPTKKNIQIALKWLVEDCQDGDSLVFYFSGHGIRQPDFNNDERDGFDETICPVDFLQEGLIADNDINATIVHPLPKGVTLHAIVDACHSGTILDLVHVYDREKNEWKDNSPPNGSKKCTNGGLAISISACEDNQMAVDTTAFSGKGMNGALTYILIEIVKKYREATYAELIDMIQETIDQVNTTSCLAAKIIRSVLHNQILQTPILSASERFDATRMHFSLNDKWAEFQSKTSKFSPPQLNKIKEKLIDKSII